MKIKGDQDIVVFEKTGELLSNLHIRLVKRMIKNVTRNTSDQIGELSGKGMLVCKNYGIVISKLVIPVIEIGITSDQVSAKLHVEWDYHRPNPDTLCCWLQHLLNY